jgi:hypothetical protein
MGNLGAGNGFQYPIGKLDVSGRESWQTLGTLNSENIDELSEAEKEASIYESLRYAVAYVNFDARPDCNPCPQNAYRVPVRYYNGSTKDELKFVGYGWELCLWVEYYSERLNVSMCGFEEFWNYSGIDQSTPVKTYKRKESNRDYNFETFCGEDDCDDVTESIYTGDPKKVWQYDPDCIVAIHEDAEYERERYSCKYIDEECVSEYEETLTLTHSAFDAGVVVSTTEKTSEFSDGATGSVILSQEDTEQEAIERATAAGPIIGNSPYSIWEVRTHQTDFVKQTSKYRIHVNFLKEKASYKVTPIIQRRSAILQAGSRPWEDVTVSPYYFTANSDRTKVIDDGGEMIELDHVQGYEYRIWDVTIEEV